MRIKCLVIYFIKYFLFCPLKEEHLFGPFSFIFCICFRLFIVLLFLFEKNHDDGLFFYSIDFDYSSCFKAQFQIYNS